MEEDGRRWKKMEEDGGRWRKMEEDGRKKKVRKKYKKRSKIFLSGKCRDGLGALVGVQIAPKKIIGH